MSKIQIDMFEVQLGAAILLQFMAEDGVVRVLADAGIKASGYELERVRDRLLPILDASGGRRIDLVIGTHYDKDHLNGLVSVINDKSITIGEAWMPPIANDTEPHALDAMLSDADLLPHQFYSESGEQHLISYLAAKRADCEMLLVLEGQRELRQDLRTWRPARLNRYRSRDNSVEFFRNQLNQLIPEGDCHHGTDQEIEPDPEVDAVISKGRIDWSPETPWYYRSWLNLDHQLEIAKRIRKYRPELADAQARSLANIRKGAAKDAINATALHAVMQALRARKIPVRCEIIADGTPRRYAWRKRERRFVAGALPSDGPELKLLGPSRALVRKHWNRLPVEDASNVALLFLSEIKSITPSNQLSYIARIGFAGQGILISGDAGCVDFKSARGKYYPELLKAMPPLHVVQVAHHGGNNAHFYRVLTAAKFPEQSDRSLLLLSHATNDQSRPSPEFREFLLSTLKQDDHVQLLFTSRPARDKVADYLAAIHPVVGTPGAVGDVRIAFDGRRWRVRAHAVRL
jgi:beta-lactamase superfamily II metal-dependent hydrolase